MDSKTNSTVIETDNVVIDLDGSEKTPEDEIYDWDGKVRKSLLMADNELVVGNLMKQYVQSLEEMIMHFDGNESLRITVFCHLKFLYNYFSELQCYNSDNYLTYMEDILTLYCNLEFEIVRRFTSPKMSKSSTSEKVLQIAKRIIFIVTVYLFEKRESILHVLMRMTVSNKVPICGDIVNHIFKHFLCTCTESTRDNDEAFCRIYILYQKWKDFVKPEKWDTMDTFLYKISHRNPEEIKNNETLRKILTPSSESVVTIIFNVCRSYDEISKAYFNHISSKKYIDIDNLDLNIDLSEDEPPIIPDHEELKFLELNLEFEQQMLTAKESAPNPPENLLLSLKKEVDDEDDDVVFVSVTMLHQPEEAIIPTDVESPEARFPEPPQLVEKEALQILNLNGISKLCISSVATISEAETPAVPEEPLASSTPLSPSPPVQEQIDTSSVQEEIRILEGMQVLEQEIEVEMQEGMQEEMPCLQAEDINKAIADGSEEEEDQQSCVYDDFGLTTPPFDFAATEKQVTKCVYTNIGDVQTKKEIVSDGDYIDYGLTPPTDVPVEDSRLEEEYPSSVNARENEEKECECENGTVAEMELEETVENTEIIETAPILQQEEETQIDTGQKSVPDTAPNIAEVVIKNLIPKETLNGNPSAVLKPLLTSNHRSNGLKEAPQSPQKIVYPFSKPITASFTQFCSFEDRWNHHKENAEFDSVLSGPVTGKLTIPTCSSPVKLAISESRANSPGDITSPAYETMRSDDFRDFYSDSVKQCVPQGILKKKNSSTSGDKVRKKNVVIDETPSLFEIRSNHSVEEAETESVCSVKRQRIPKGLRSDPKLNQRPTVVVERLTIIENAVRKSQNAPSGTLRVDYDKSTQYLNNKDVIRPTSPPRISLKIKSNKSGSSIVTTLSRSNEYERRPEKRKYEVPPALSREVPEPVTKKKLVFRSSKKKAFELRTVQEEDEEEKVQQQPKKRQQRNSKKLVNNSTSGKTNNLLSNNSDSEIDKVLKSEGYTHQPFRVDFTS